MYGLGWILGPGDNICLLMAVIPVGTVAISWWMPRGAPGVAVSVLVWAVVYWPEDPGPTSATLSLFFTVVFVGAALFVEYWFWSGAVHLDKSRRQDEEVHE